MAVEWPKCIRCGVCCIVATCSMGKIDKKTGICSYLTIHKEGHTSCKYIEQHENPFSRGCFLRSPGALDTMYKYYKDMAEEKVKMKLVGIKEKT